MTYKDVEETLKLTCEKSGNTYRVCSDLLPGTPPVGIGKTKLQAKYNFFLEMMYDWKTWGKYLKVNTI